MRGLSIVLLIAMGSVFADQPTTHPLTAKEAAALQEPIALGHRILNALSRYAQTSEPPMIPAELDLLTRVPTIEILHAAGYISDSDMPLAHRYLATLQPIPPGAPSTQPLLTMQTDRGELILDTRGTVTLRQHK
jgi:hypothetical protein